MRGADGNPLRIIPRIAAGDYMTFGICLLQDKNGVNVGLLKKTHAHDGPVGITDAIIQKWLTSGAAPTRTYQHLIECLRLSELDTLAEDIDTHTLVATGIKISIAGVVMLKRTIPITVSSLKLDSQSSYDKRSLCCCITKIAHACMHLYNINYTPGMHSILNECVTGCIAECIVCHSACNATLP